MVDEDFNEVLNVEFESEASDPGMDSPSKQGSPGNYEPGPGLQAM